MEEEVPPVRTLCDRLKSIHSELGWRYHVRIIALNPEGYGMVRFCGFPRIVKTRENQMKLKSELEKYYDFLEYKYTEEDNYTDLEFRVKVNGNPTTCKLTTIVDMSK